MINHLPPGFVKTPKLPPKARLATWKERTEDNLIKIPQAAYTGWCAVTHGHSKDHMLGRLDDTTRTLGVVSIAGLGALGTPEPGGSLPLWLGAASWLGAMAVTPKLINGAVYMKTGVNLNTRYINSNGQIQPLFLDPNYMPLHVLPPEKRQQLALRLGISLDDSNGQIQLKNKLKQIAVQAFTWWMLMAGMATPVIASSICDRIEDPFKSLASRFRQWKAYHYQVIPALNAPHTSAQKLTKAVETLLDSSIGSGTEVTVLSRWWKQLPEKIVQTLHLDKLPQKDLLHPSPTARFEKVVQHLHRQLPQIETKANLELLLQHKQQELNSILSPLEALLQHPKVNTKIPRKTQTLLAQRLQLTRDTAEATLLHFKRLLTFPLQSLPATHAQAKLSQQMEKSVLSYALQLSRQGKISEAIQLSGGPSQFQKVLTSFTENRFGPAFQQMGDSPKSFLLRALNSLGLRHRWLKLYPGLIGGGMIIATALFCTVFLGADFNTGTEGRKSS